MIRSSPTQESKKKTACCLRVFSKSRAVFFLFCFFTGLTGLAGCAWISKNPTDIWLENRCEKHLDTPVSVGVLLPLSGKFEWYGKTVLEGIELGMDCFGQHPTECKSFKLVVRDTAGLPEQAVFMLDELVENQHVVAVIGPLFSSEAQAAAARAEDIGIPLIALSSLPDLPELGDYVFTNFLTRGAEVASLVQHARKVLNIESFAVLFPDDHDGRAFYSSFRSELEASGGRVVKAIGYPPDVNNFTPIVKQLVGRNNLNTRRDFIKKRDLIKLKYRNHPLKIDKEIEKLRKQIPPVIDFEALFVPDVYEKIAMLAPALAFEDVVLKTSDPKKISRIKKSIGRDKLDMIYLFGTDGWNHPKLIEWAGRYLEGSIFCDGFYVNSRRSTTDSFVRRFRNRFKRDPNTLAAHAFDVIGILKQTLKQKMPCATSELRDALLDIVDFDGVCGPASMSSEGSLEKRLFMLTVKNGRVVELEIPPPVS